MILSFNGMMCNYSKEKWALRTDRGGPEPGRPLVKTSPFNAGSVGSIPGQQAKIPHALWPKNQNIKQKQCCNKINQDFKNGPHQKKKILKKKKKKTDMEKPWRHTAKWVGSNGKR